MTDAILTSGQIDAVVRTGGSVQIPRFIDMLGRLFGPDKVVLSDTFSGVTAGMAIRAGMDKG
jgi:molecular chaperone DnaK (HSP70)